MQTLNLEEAAKFLKIHPETLKLKAKSGEIPGAKIGRAWVFIDEDLADCIRNNYCNTKDHRQVTQENNYNSQFSNEKTDSFGGTGSRHQTAEEFANYLKQEIKRKRKN